MKYIMNKVIIFLKITIVLIYFSSCKKEPQEVFPSSVALDKTFVELAVGCSVNISATVLPENTTNKTIVWSSSDDSVVNVEDGLVSALKIGGAEVKATCGNKFAKCVVKVKPIEVESITLDKTSASLRAGESITLIATVNPSDATDKSVTWTSSNPSVATVENGVVKAIKVGSATITAKAGDKTATCTINVEATPVTSITLDKTSASLRAGESITLTATVNPSDATDKSVTWSSSIPSVATVENGIVKAIKVGNATITAKSGDKTATCAIKVEATPVTSITLDKTGASLRAGESITLIATVNPSDATDKSVTWSSSNPSVATVENGVVKAIKVGNATITAKAGNVLVTCIIDVVPSASGGHEGTTEEDW